MNCLRFIDPEIMNVIAVKKTWQWRKVFVLFAGNWELYLSLSTATCKYFESCGWQKQRIIWKWEILWVRRRFIIHHIAFFYCFQHDYALYYMCLILRENNVLGVRCIDMVSGSFTGRWPLRAYWLGPARWEGLSRDCVSLFASISV